MQSNKLQLFRISQSSVRPKSAIFFFYFCKSGLISAIKLQHNLGRFAFTGNTQLLTSPNGPCYKYTQVVSLYVHYTVKCILH